MAMIVHLNNVLEKVKFSFINGYFLITQVIDAAHHG